MNIHFPHLDVLAEPVSRRPRWILPATRFLMGASIGLTVCFGLPSESRAEQPKAGEQVDVVASTKSSFVDDPNFGKDPFFPNSKRRGVQAVVPTNSVVTVSIPDFILKGISGTKARRLALINNYTIGVGEVMDMKIGAQIVPVRCVEIRDKAVLIEVRGQTKELRFRQGL